MSSTVCFNFTIGNNYCACYTACKVLIMCDHQNGLAFLNQKIEKIKHLISRL